MEFNAFRNRIIFTFSLFIIVPIIISSMFWNTTTVEEVENAYTTIGASVVKQAVSLIDGDAFEALVQSQDTNSYFYKYTLDKLVQLRKISNCFYLYTLAQVDGDIWQFIIDASEIQDTIGTKEDVSTYDDAFKKTWTLGTVQLGNLEYQEKWGWTISTYAPIKNSSGKIVGVAGCDFSGEHLHASIEERNIKSIVITVISICFGIIFLFYYLNKFKKLHKLLESLSTTDELTKLNNRRTFLHYYDIIWKQSMRMQFNVNILMLDIDYFKNYNDSLGHLEGDDALVAVANCLQSQIKRDTDFLARFGGEEFVCLIPYVEKEKAEAFAKKLLQSIEKMQIIHPNSKHSKYLTVSIGMACVIPNEHCSKEQLLDEADRALYAAKRSGRNRVVVNSAKPC